MEQQMTTNNSPKHRGDIKTLIEQSEKLAVTTKIGDLLFCPEFLPSSDPIFTTMMKDKAMFAGLYRSITGEDVKLPSDPIPQAYIESFNALRKTVRADVLDVDVDERTLTMDMQRRYIQSVCRGRTVYYASCLIANQTVSKMGYDKLKGIAVTFIMSEASDKKPIRRIRLYDDIDGYELYSDLITIYEVYVPTVIEQKLNGDIYIYSRFFGIATAEDLQKFADELSDNALARSLAQGYKEVFTLGRFRLLADVEEDAFWSKGSEELYAEGVIDGELKGKLEGKLEEKFEAAQNALDLGLTIEQAAKISGLDVQKISDELCLTHA
jgi:predicted transposase/invertase (TIGR01784 family)